MRTAERARLRARACRAVGARPQAAWPQVARPHTAAPHPAVSATRSSEKTPHMEVCGSVKALNRLELKRDRSCRRSAWLGRQLQAVGLAGAAAARVDAGAL
eukprot:6554295-Prymnesium_polylepis.2